MNLSPTSRENSSHPLIIQGGMGIGVSNWKLARAVSERGQLGVVSGTAIDTVMVRRLQDGDIDGATRHALAHFPHQEIAKYIVNHYYIQGGRKKNQPYKLLPLPKALNQGTRDKIAVAAGFVEVFLAKEGHSGLVGMNLLTKIQHTNLPILYGAMLAGVDYILMGAGIPKEIPGILDKLALHQPVRLKLEVEGSKEQEPIWISFEPSLIFNVSEDRGKLPPLKRPYFFPIVSSHSLAMMLSRKSNGNVDGFIVENPLAGGHNAPPRGGIRAEGEVKYGERDEVDLSVMSSLGLPFWLAGGMASPECLRVALEKGAAGIQVGTLFALSEESGFTPEIKQKIINALLSDNLRVKTAAFVSPTGFPFKMIALKDSLSEESVYQERFRHCDLGYLRTAYLCQDGSIGFRCPGERVSEFVKKGGLAEKTVNCRCLCNALLAAVGLGQVRQNGTCEPPLITGSGEARQLKPFLASLSQGHFPAIKALDYLLEGASCSC